MLGNDEALWESLLAAIKLGAVISPASTLLTADDLQDRVDRGRVRHVIAGASHTEPVRDGERSFHEDRRRTADRPDGRHSRRAYRLRRPSSPMAAPGRPIRCCCTSPPARRRSRRWCCTRTRATRSATSRRCTSPACSRATPLEHQLAGLGQARLEQLLRAVERRGDGLHVQLRTVSTRRACWTHSSRYRVTALCAPPTVWRMLIQEPLPQYPVALREALSAGEPLNPEVIEQVREAWGVSCATDTGRPKLRP